MKGSNSTYFGHVKEAVSSLLQGLRLSFRHLREANKSRKSMGIADDAYFEQQTGIVTLQYPKESLPVPDNGRYQLHNEIEDCIVCDKCAKICPVDCIAIEPVKAVEEIGKTSDGTPKRLYAAKFDIDMGKCCFCGLCTTVCPTECLTMTKNYDFSAYDSADHIYAFSEMSPLEILQKKKELEAHKQQKEAEKAAKPTAGGRPGAPRPIAARPKAVPPIAARPKPAAEGKEEGEEAKAMPRPAFKPKIKSPSRKNEEAFGLSQSEAAPASGEGKAQEEEKSRVQPKPRFRPKIKAPAKPADAEKQAEAEEEAKAVPKEKEDIPEGTEKKAPSGSGPRPLMKPKIKSPARAEGKQEEERKPPRSARPLIRPKTQAKEEPEESPSEDTKRPRPLVKPTGVPKKPSEEEKSEDDKLEEKKVKPVYRPRPIIRKKKDEE